jgi:hypothetical protein
MSAVGQTRSWNGSNGGPSRAFEYREGDHIFVVEWDPRETGTVIAEYFERWTEPSSEPIDPAARERIFDGLWAVGQTAGITSIVDESRSLRCTVPARWNRGDDGFLIDVHDGGQLDYMERRRAMRLSYREEAGKLYVAFVKWPDEPRWTEPDAPIAADHADKIRERIGGAKSTDMRVGAHVPWKLVVEREGARA